MKNKEPKIDEVISLLQETGQTGMADELSELNKSNTLSDLSQLALVERLASAQLIRNINSLTTRYTKQAHLYWPSAEMEEIIYRPDRHIDKLDMDRLGTNDYIRYHQNLFVLGPTGCGKTFLLSALGNSACRDRFRVRYFILSDFFYECDKEERLGKLDKYLTRLSNINLIIFDDFLLTTVTQKQAEYIYKLLVKKPKHDKQKAYIIGSQLMKAEMYNRLHECSASLADTIIDRLSARSQLIEMSGGSMRRDDGIKMQNG